MKYFHRLRTFLTFVPFFLASGTSLAQSDPLPRSGDFEVVGESAPRANTVAISEGMTAENNPGFRSTLGQPTIASPIAALNTYLDGFHFMSGDMNQQMEAHHYCSKLNEDLTQCVVYDGNGPQAKLMGVEYVVSRRIYETLPESERKLWHSHVYEVKSGGLVAPGVPRAAEYALMEDLIDTYGKTWHTWHTHRADNAVPTGVPALMMGFTADGQLRQELASRRDQALGADSLEARRNRADIASPQIASGADAWQKGSTLQVRVMDSTAKKDEGHAVLMP